MSTAMIKVPRTRFLLVVLFLFLIANSTHANPIFPSADPDAVVFGKTYWMYPSAGGSYDPKFRAYSSGDLRTWQDRGVVLDMKDISWVDDGAHARHGAWAPTIFLANKKYYFYYAIGPQSENHPSRIGVAVGDEPQGPFKDIGKPLINDGGHGFEAIDPMTFADPKTGIVYLYAGGSAGSKLRVWVLNNDLISLKREVKVDTPREFTEGVFMHERNGLYYLSYSHGRWNDADYSVHYATSSTPIGPWNYRGCILSSDATHKGPGHHSFVENPVTGKWFIVYHRWETTVPEGPYKGKRQIAIEQIEYNRDGTIKPIKMTDGDGPISPIQ